MVTRLRNSNPLIFIPPIAIGVLFLVGALVAAILLKPGIEGRIQKTSPVKNLTLGMEVERLDREIRAKDEQIRTDPQKPSIEKQAQDAMRKLDEALGKKPSSDVNQANIEQEKAANIKRLEDEKAQLVAKREAVVARMRENTTRTWREWYGDLEIGLALMALLPLGILSIFFVRLLLSGRVPKANPFSLTNFEKRSLLFFITSFFVSAFALFLFVWILSVKNNVWG